MIAELAGELSNIAPFQFVHQLWVKDTFVLDIIVTYAAREDFATTRSNEVALSSIVLASMLEFGGLGFWVFVFLLTLRSFRLLVPLNSTSFGGRFLCNDWRVTSCDPDLRTTCQLGRLRVRFRVVASNTAAAAAAAAAAICITTCAAAALRLVLHPVVFLAVSVAVIHALALPTLRFRPRIPAVRTNLCRHAA
jgi:hypothetical protein